jgi:hypothetical protein
MKTNPQGSGEDCIDMGKKALSKKWARIEGGSKTSKA